MGWQKCSGIRRSCLDYPWRFKNRYPQPGKWIDNGPISEYKKVAEILTSHSIPLLSVNSAAGHISNTGHSGELNQTLVDEVTALRGRAESVYLPEHGIRGNSHMMFFEKNSDEIASLLVKWIEQMNAKL